MVAIFCGKLIGGEAPTVYGDGGQTRDWVEVSDVVRANLLAAESQLTGPINIGHGRETSVLELLAALQRGLWPGGARARVRARASRRGAPQLSRRQPRQAGARMGG